MKIPAFSILPLCAGLISLVLMASTVQARQVRVVSPDGKVSAFVNDDGGALTYRVTADGKPVLDSSPIGLRSNGRDLGKAVSIKSFRRGKIDERYAIFGGKAWASNKANTATISLASNGETIEADVHVANDGVAVRLRLPALPGRSVDADLSGWNLAGGNPRLWATEFLPDYENVYAATTLDKLGNKNYGLPLTAKVNGLWVTLSEAAVVDYGDSSIHLNDGTLVTSLYADPQGWHTDEAVVQPWRVTIVARDLTGLVNTTLVQNLNPPPSKALAGAKWIRPGRSSWQWLAIGDPLEGDQKQWVDWTHQLGFEYYLIDDGWAKWQQPWQSLTDTVAYARTQGVGIWVWVHSNDVATPAARQALFRRFADIGVVGVKVDFPQGANREWTNWYIDTAKEAAADHLMVDFHGAAKPSGTERTWPNVLTREGVRGHEWHITRYNRKLPSEHDTILPFTRYVVGPGDYTPTVFEPKELQGNSWAHELAQMVIFTSPYLSMGGHPETYLSNPGLDVLKAVPAIWDQTLVLDGSEPGKAVIMARRSGNDWYIAAINNGEARDVTVKLSFLQKGPWQLVELSDSQDKPDAYNRHSKPVTPDQSITLNMRARGGFVARLQIR
ncbi:glycoside hydrolase family 97 protein [Asticcacaulis sp. AC466]|uniref:glycoside hydrolase family 97 protein n=1 Tax=Asticcacaulis sp. AC466 TaxID=1282362 RepID=UPI00040CF3C1|nr:glycoside hydrolase family 97 protein [Asticcacaulis sp. AC466]